MVFGKVFREVFEKGILGGFGEGGCGGFLERGFQ